MVLNQTKETFNDAMIEKLDSILTVQHLGVNREDIVKEIKNVDADNAYRKKGFKGMVGHLSEKAQIPLADGGFDKTWKELSIFEKRELIGDTIDFTNTIDIPGYGIDYFREEGAETDFLKDFIIQYVDSVDMLTTLRATLIAGQNNPSIYREHIE